MKQAFNTAFEGRNKSAIIAELTQCAASLVQASGLRSSLEPKAPDWGGEHNHTEPDTPGVEPHQRHFGPSGSAFSRQTPISIRPRPAKDHSGHARYKAGQSHCAGQKFGLWDSHGWADHELRAGSFSQDSRGRWYFNVAVQVQSKPSAGTAAIGIGKFANKRMGLQRMWHGTRPRTETSTPPRTFSRRDIAVWQQASPSLYGGEDIKFVTADRRYFDKGQHLAQITWLADFAVS